jgi:hypothetical protein
MSETIHFDKNKYQAYAALAKKAGYKNVDELVDEALEDFILKYVIEREDVTVKIPVKLLAFFKENKKDNLQEYLNNIITDSLAADISTRDYGHVESIKQEWGLTEEFSFYEGH